MIPASQTQSPLQRKLQEKLAAIKERKQALIKPTIQDASEASGFPHNPSSPSTITSTIPTNHILYEGTDRHGHTIKYNERQLEAIDLVASGKSCVIIGAAGTGKTTIQKASTQALIDKIGR